MLELLLAVSLIAVFTAVITVLPAFEEDGYHVFPDQYLRLQTEAMMNGESREYEDSYSQSLPLLRFNENGNINMARTITFSQGKAIREIVVELGGGRLVFK